MSHTEPGTVEGQPAEIGRDPRQMTEQDLVELGHHKRPILRVIRENCIQCVGGSEAEVRRCRMVTCPMWPYRMATNPFHQGREMSDEERQAARDRLVAARAARPTA